MHVEMYRIALHWAIMSLPGCFAALAVGTGPCDTMRQPASCTKPQLVDSYSAAAVHV
jgi:hypothetical protein